jgi:hypothetical protein
LKSIVRHASDEASFDSALLPCTSDSQRHWAKSSCSSTLSYTSIPMPPSSPTRGEIHSPALTQRHSSSFPVAPNRPFPFRQHSTASEPPSSPPPKPPPPAPPSPISIHLLAHFALFSILGTLARLGLTALFSYPGQAVFALIWAQGVGCFLMGCLTGRKSDVEKVLGTVGFVALSTGEAPHFRSSACGRLFTL